MIYGRLVHILSRWKRLINEDFSHEASAVTLLETNDIWQVSPHSSRYDLFRSLGAEKLAICLQFSGTKSSGAAWP